MKGRVLIVAIAIFLPMSVPSYADWQYTRWGMNLQELISASNGKAKHLSVSESQDRSRPNLQALATAFYATGEFEFEVDFLFLDGRLKMVAMGLLNIERSDDLSDALFAKYGQPFQNKEYDLGENIKWRDAQKDDVITFYYIPTLSTYTVMYEPSASEGL